VLHSGKEKKNQGGASLAKKTKKFNESFELKRSGSVRGDRGQVPKDSRPVARNRLNDELALSESQKDSMAKTSDGRKR